ncbi:MAG: hypothetical protein HGA53_06870 [Anaerolineaceae bacterium]|nr:hypothetical protein [Anaerolineaceae bacterium]
MPIILGANGIGGTVSDNIGNITAPALWEPLRTVYLFLAPYRFDRTWAEMMTIYAIAAVVFAILLAVKFIKMGKKPIISGAKNIFVDIQDVPEIKSKLILLGSWLILPILLLFILSVVLIPIFRDRYAISSAPAFYILASLLIYKIRKVIPIAFSIVVLLIPIVPGLQTYYVTDTKEQWSEAAGIIKENIQNYDQIVFAPNMGVGIQELTFDMYYPDPYHGCGIDYQFKDQEAIANAFQTCLIGFDRFWVIIPYYEPGDPYRSYFLDPKNETTLHLVKAYPLVDLAIYLFEKK